MNNSDIQNFNNKYIKYKINYSEINQKGGSNIRSKDGYQWSNEMVKDKYESLVKVLGNPNYITTKYKSKEIENVKWQNPLTRNKMGKFKGADMIMLSDQIALKRHPEPAPVFVIAGKYLKVPDHLLGPIKYASEPFLLYTALQFGHINLSRVLCIIV